MGIERLASEYEVETRWLAYPFHTDVPASGGTLFEYLGFAPQELEVMQTSMEREAQQRGLAFGQIENIYNSRMAQELAAWGRSRLGDDRVHQALFAAYFADGQNISDTSVLIRLAKSVGLPADEAARVLAERRFRGDVDAEWARSRELGIQAIPTFFLGEHRLVGAQPYSRFASWSETHGVRKRTAG